MLIEKVPYGEIIAPGAGVDVWYRSNPFRRERQYFRADAALTVAEIVELARSVYGIHQGSNLSVTLDGHVIGAGRWARIRVKPGVSVNIVAVPSGNFFKQILGLVAAIAISIFLPGIGSTIAGVLGFASGSVGASIVTGIVGAGLTVAASLAVNALFPTSTAGSSVAESTKQLYSIGGGNNSAAQFGAVPVIFGTHRVSPPYASGPYTELNGNDQYLRMLFCVGYGPIDVSDVKIGETPIGDFASCQYEIISDSTVSSPTLYTMPVYEETVSVELDYASSWATRTTADKVDWISVDISFPSGVYRYQKSDGNRVNYTLNIDVQYSPKGANSWVPAGNVTIVSSSNQPIRRTVAWSVANGQYDVRLRKTTSDYIGDDTISEKTFWSALRARRNIPAIKFSKPLTLLALYIKATNELNGTVNQLNLTARPRINVFNGTSWASGQNSQNPADHFRFVLQGSPNARPVDDTQIDLVSLQRWWSYCKANGFKFNYVTDNQKSVYDTLTMVAAAGRAAVTFNDGKWGVVWDVANSPIVQHFSPRNSWNFSSMRAYADLPHGFRVAFLNEKNNYLKDERVVYDDGYSAANATKFEGIDFPGVTDPDLIWKHGRYHIAQLRLQREVYTLYTDFEHLVCQRGDRVRVNHDAVLWGAGAGRVKQVLPNGVVVDDTFSMTSGKTYSMRFRGADGSTLVRTINGSTGNFSSFTFADTGTLPNVGDLCLFGENTIESVVLRVKAITPQADLAAKLELVDDAPAIMQADVGTIPEFVTGIPAMVDYRSYAPGSLTYTESVSSSTPPTSSIDLAWVAPGAGTVQQYLVQYAPYGSDDWSPSQSVFAPSLRLDGVAAGSYSVRVRAIFSNGQLSRWLTTTFNATIFITSPPQVQDFRIAVSGDAAILQWTESQSASIAGYQIRYSPLLSGATWQTSTVLRQLVTGGSTQVSTTPGTYLIKAVNYGGVSSVDVAEIVSTIDALTSFNAVVSVFDTDFLGSKTATSASGGNLRLVTAGDLFSISDIFSLSDVFLAGGGYVPEGYYYLSGYTDLGGVYSSRLTAAIDAYAESSSEDVFNRYDFFAVSDVFGGIGNVWDVTAEVSTTNDDPSASPVWSTWAELVAGDVSARAYRFRLVLSSAQPDITPVVSSVKIDVDMADRVIAGNDIPVGTGGVSIGFSPPYKVLQGVSIAAQGLNTGDYYEISSKSASGFTIVFKDAGGTPVARTLDYVAKGYGSAA